MLALGLAAESSAGVISVWTRDDADPGGIMPGDVFTLVIYAEDTGPGAGIISANFRLIYDPSEVDVVSIIDNVSPDQSSAPYGPGFQLPVPGTSGAVDDDAGVISSFGGSILPASGGVPIAAAGSPAVIGAVEFRVLDIGAGAYTKMGIFPNEVSPSDTFGMAGGLGGDGGANLPYRVDIATVIVIPEPATAAGAILGAGLLAARRRTRRRG